MTYKEADNVLQDRFVWSEQGWRGITDAAARRALQARHRRGRARPRREAASHARAGRRGRRQPPHGRARVPETRRARLRDRLRRSRHLRARPRPRGERGVRRRLAGLRTARARCDLSGARAGGCLRQRGRPRPDLARGRLALTPPLSDRRARADRRRRLRGGGRRGALLPAGRGPVRVPRAARAARAPLRLGRRTGRDRGRVGGQAGAQPRCQGDARGGRCRGGRVTHLPRPARVAAPDGRARDRRAGRRGRPRCGRARAPARAPRGQARRAPDGLPQPNGAQPLRGAPPAPCPARRRAQLLHHRGPRLRGHELRRQRAAADPRARAGARDLRELALEGRRRRTALPAGLSRAGPCASGSRC